MREHPREHPERRRAFAFAIACVDDDEAALLLRGANLRVHLGLQ